MSQPVFCDYYEQEFSPEFLEKAMDYYLKWCKAKGETPEIDEGLGAEQFEGNQELLSHVLYHAELQGLNFAESH